MNQYSDIRQADQLSLDAAKSEFFRAGGCIETLQSYRFEPRPVRIEPVISEAEVERRAYVEKVRKMGETMSQNKITAALGVSTHSIYQLCKKNGITCMSGKGRKPGDGGIRIDHEADARMVERLRALAEIGLTKNQARAQAGLGWHVTARLVDTYSIEFKKAGS